MNKDLTIGIDDKMLNVRVGCIFYYDDCVLLEYHDKEEHQTIPGGRVKVMENSKDALIREIMEELGFRLNRDRIIKSTVIENMFNYCDKDFHEIYFIYKYVLIDKEYNALKEVKRNKDNDCSYFKFVRRENIKDTQVLPVSLKDLLQEKNYIKKEKSCGALIVKDDKVLIVKQTNHLWSFPKGHVEGDETEAWTAVREIKEETNLDVEIDTGFRYQITYCPNKPDTLKDVVFFLARPVSDDILLQEEEIEDYKWETFDNVENLFKGRSDQDVISELKEYLGM